MTNHPDVCVYPDCDGTRENLIVNTWRNDNVRFEIEFSAGVVLVDLNVDQVRHVHAQLDEWLHANYQEAQ